MSTQEKLDRSVIKELLGASPVIAGVKLRPITLASIALLKQIESPLIDGRAYSEIDNIILDCCLFLKIQSMDIKTATKLVFGDYNELVAQAMELADTINPNSIKEVIDSIVSLLQDSTTTKVEVVDDGSDAKAGDLLKAIHGGDIPVEDGAPPKPVQEEQGN